MDIHTETDFSNLLSLILMKYINGYKIGRGADLEGANLKGANLWGADLRGAFLKDADLRCSNLEGADLMYANLKGANLWDADLRYAKLKGANLEGADLEGAVLKGADLEGADLRDANLQDASLRGAKLQDAKLDYIPGSQDLLKKVAEHALAKEDSLEMCDWHRCDTTHCIAGWATHLHPEGRDLEDKYGTEVAGLLLLGSEAHSHFFDYNEDAKRYLKSVLE
jgi:hypothetical protein